MGLFPSSTSSIKRQIETVAFPAPDPSYTKNHPYLKIVTGIENKEERKVACMFYKVNNERKIILYSHGNATDIGFMHNFLFKLSNTLSTNIVSYDYEGYGLTKGKPSEDGCIRSINIVYKHLLSLGYLSDDILLYGVSIGTGPTVALASRLSQANNILKGVLLQTPYTSAIGVCSETLAYSSQVSSSLSLCEDPNIFRSIDKIKYITAPITIIHGTNDEVIPYRHAEELQNENKRAKLVKIPGATHNSIEANHYNTLVKCIEELFDNDGYYEDDFYEFNRKIPQDSDNEKENEYYDYDRGEPQFFNASYSLPN
jgi:fermentation-respiration switch protein FrsA (DUF1100 family)